MKLLFYTKVFDRRTNKSSLKGHFFTLNEKYKQLEGRGCHYVNIEEVLRFKISKNL